MIKENGEPATLEEFFEAYQKNKVTPAQLKKLKSNLKILQCKAEQKRYMNIYMKY